MKVIRRFVPIYDEYAKDQNIYKIKVPVKVNYPISNCDYIGPIARKAEINLWVAYERGGKTKITCEEYERGYYLYIYLSGLEDCFYLPISEQAIRVHLGWVSRKSPYYFYHFAAYASNYAMDILDRYFPQLDFKWDEITKEVAKCDYNCLGDLAEMFDVKMFCKPQKHYEYA